MVFVNKDKINNNNNYIVFVVKNNNYRKNTSEIVDTVQVMFSLLMSEELLFHIKITKDFIERSEIKEPASFRCASHVSSLSYYR